MNWNRYPLLSLLLGISLAVLSGCNSTADNGAAEEKQAASQQDSLDQALLAQSQKLFKALPEPADFERPIAKLGKKLYYETSLSISNEMSCNTCHQLDNYGVDNEKTSLGHDKTTRGERNSPTVYNAALHVAQFWDGRAADLVEQAKGPVLNPVEMGMPGEEAVLKNLNNSEDYKQMFAEAFPGQNNPVSFHNMALAIAEFEKTLLTPSKFDQYIQGDISALSETEREGLATFMQVGCTSCHTGPALGGEIYQKFGLFTGGNYWEHTGSEHIDSGRVKVTGQQSDAFMFKVPSLRNISKTAPYFHDGSVAELAEAIKIMGTTQLGRELSDEEVAEIEAFLNSLTGEVPQYALQQPAEEMASL